MATLAAALTALTISLFPQGTDGPKRLWSVRCPAHPDCARLARVGRSAFAPVPSGTACTQIYGGPQVAIVSGVLDGRRLWARFRRTDGCEIGRWNRVAFLFS